ncbi:MAG: hypothetical protein L0Y72_26715, partial [Gemmataceae bacterium]|nr:hypothetical protein [Gemmataceae bacterium]
MPSNIVFGPEAIDGSAAALSAPAEEGFRDIRVRSDQTTVGLKLQVVRNSTLEKIHLEVQVPRLEWALSGVQS